MRRADAASRQRAERARRALEQRAAARPRLSSVSRRWRVFSYLSASGGHVRFTPPIAAAVAAAIAAVAVADARRATATTESANIFSQNPRLAIANYNLHNGIRSFAHLMHHLHHPRARVRATLCKQNFFLKFRKRKYSTRAVACRMMPLAIECLGD